MRQVSGNNKVIFEPFDLFDKRLALSKEESDSVYFMELLLKGEFLCKVITSVTVSSIMDDKERTKYQYEYRLVRANGIGEWASVIDEIINNQYEKLLPDFAYNEAKQLKEKVKNDRWQYKAVSLLKSASEKLKIDLNPLSTKLSLRRWFSDFAIIRNKTIRGHGAQRASDLSKCITDLEESIELIVNNFYSFSNRSWAYLYQNISGKYRVSCVSSTSHPFDYLKKKISHKKKYSNALYVFIDEPIKLCAFYSDPELTDFFISNGDFKKGQFETISYISGAREKNSGNDYLLPVDQLPKSETEGMGKLLVQGESFGNIPPEPELYVNRDEIESELIRVLKDSNRFPVITLRGKGGIGKTTTTLNCLHEVSKIEEYDLIIWFSSRDIDLKIEGPKNVKSKIFNIQDIADEFCNLLEIDIDSKSKRKDFLKDNLEESKYGKILYVFDNFETIDDPLEVYNWLYTYIRHPNKILITSRESRDFKADYPIEIGRMKYDECEKLIERYSKKFNIHLIISNAYKDKLISESNGHPYIIKILLGEVAKQNKEVAIKRIVAGRDDILTALFRRTYDTLSPAAVRIFLTLCSWRSLVSQIALEAVLLRPENEERMNVEDGIDELRKSSFIDVFTSEKDNTIFVNVPLAASVFGKSELDIYSDKLAVLKNRELLMQFGVGHDNGYEMGLKPFVDKKFSEIANQLDKKRESERLHYLQEHLPVLEYIANYYPKAWELLGFLYMELGLENDYINSILQYIKFSPSSSEKRKSWRRLASIFKKRNEWKKESHAMSEICLIPDTHITEISDIANRINTQFRNTAILQDKEHKELVIQKISEMFEMRINESDNGDDYSRLSWLFLHLKDKSKAKKYTNIGLAKDPTNFYCLQLLKKLQ